MNHTCLFFRSRSWLLDDALYKSTFTFTLTTECSLTTPSDFVNGHEVTVWFVVCCWPVAIVARRWFGLTPFVQVHMTRVLTC